MALDKRAVVAMSKRMAKWLMPDRMRPWVREHVTWRPAQLLPRIHRAPAATASPPAAPAAPPEPPATPPQAPATPPEVTTPPHRAVDEMELYSLEIPARSGEPPRLSVPRRRDYYLVRKLLDGGLPAFEPETVATVLAAVAHRGNWFFDVGANIGIFTWLVAAAVPGTNIQSFEPSPELVDMIDVTLEANGLHATIDPVAVGSHVGTATLFLSPTDTSNSLRAGFRDAVGTLDVPVTTIDEVVRQTGRVPGVIKIDTEATEPDVLAGARQVVRQHRPWIVCEVLAGRTEEGIADWLAETGYVAHHLRDEVPPPVATVIEGDRTYTHFNWLFTPEPPDTSFWDEVREWRHALDRITA